MEEASGAAGGGAEHKKCTSCLAEIPAAAKFCQHCTRRQPDTDEAKAERTRKWGWLTIASLPTAFIILVIAARLSYAHDEARIRNCEMLASLPPGTIRGVADKAAREGNIGVHDALEVAIGLECPMMKR